MHRLDLNIVAISAGQQYEVFLSLPVTFAQILSQLHCAVLMLHQLSLADESWVGIFVCYKDSAVVTIDGQEIDKNAQLSYPAKVRRVDGDKLRIDKAWINISDCLTIENAIDELTESLRVDPANVRALYRRGNCYRKTKAFDRAMADLNEAIRIDKLCVDAYLYRGRLKAEQRDLNGALSDLLAATMPNEMEAVRQAVRLCQ